MFALACCHSKEKNCIFFNNQLYAKLEVFPACCPGRALIKHQAGAAEGAQDFSFHHCWLVGLHPVKKLIPSPAANYP